jgi:hypothetical protein
VFRCGALSLLQKTPHYRGGRQITARLNSKLRDLPDWWWRYLTAISPSPPLHENLKPTRKLKAGRSGSSEKVLFLREAMRAIASLSCEGVVRAIALSMSPHVSPEQGPTPIISAATAGGRTTVQTVSAAAKTQPTTLTCER